MKLICLLAGVLLGSIAHGQAHYELIENGSKYSTSEISNAFSTANFCGAYYTSKRNKITFDDGSVVELLSKSEIEAKGIQLNASCFLQDSVEFVASTWSISNGYIIRATEPKPSKASLTK